jgi:hypothetical protein
MRKTKNILMFALLIIFAFSVVQISLSLGLNAQAEVLSPYEEDGGLSLSVGYAGGYLTLTAPPGSDGYQFWIKQKVPTDAGSSDVKEQFIWQLLGTGYSDSNTASVTVTEGEGGNIGTYLDEYGKFNAIVRIKDDGVLLGEVYGSYSKTEAGMPAITGVSVNGKEYYGDYTVVSGEALDIMINGSLPGMSYSVLYKGVSKSGPPKNSGTNAYCEFENFDIDFLEAGLNKLTLQAEAGDDIVQKEISLYVVKDYVASERPVIMSLTAAADTDTDGDGPDVAVAGQFHFTMKVRHADGSPLAKIEAQNLDCKLYSGNNNVTGAPELTEEGNLVLDGDNCANILFTVNYGEGKYGIYRTTGTVAREKISGYDDRIIIYYEGYARTAKLSQKGEVLISEDPDVYEEKYSNISVGSTIKITAYDAEVGGSADNLKYAFYREDASGWVLIRDYPEVGTGDTLYWKPARAGTYNIQARVKKEGDGSYEKIATKTYEITGGALSGTVGIEFYDCNDYAEEYEKDSLIAGMPYKIKAVFDDGDDESDTEDFVLYMFTLTSANLGTVYLNNFTTNPYYIFVPGRADSYTITARVIHMSSFGYKDISWSEDINAYVTDEYTSEYFYDFEKITDETVYTVDVSSLDNTPSKLKIGGIDVPFTVDGTDLIIQREYISAMSTGDYIAEFVSGPAKYIRKVAVVDKVIRDETELLNIQTYGGIQAAASGTANDGDDFDYSGYFVLARDMNLTGITVTSRYWAHTSGAGVNLNAGTLSSQGFAGIFDGRGHTIYGGTYKLGGLFGTVSLNGTVQNVAFTGVSVDTSNNGTGNAILAGYFNGTLKDVLVEGTCDGTGVNSGFIIYRATYAQLENVVIYYKNNVVNGDAGKLALVAPITRHNDMPTCENVYVFTDHTKLCGSNGNVTGVTKYSYGTKLSQASVTGLTAPFWDLGGDRASFK